MGGEEESVEQRAHQQMQHIRLGGNVASDQTHSWLLLYFIGGEGLSEGEHKHRKSEEIVLIIALSADGKKTDLVLVEEHIGRNVVYCGSAQGSYCSV